MIEFNETSKLGTSSNTPEDQLMKAMNIYKLALSDLYKEAKDSYGRAQSATERAQEHLRAVERAIDQYHGDMPTQADQGAEASS